jgi:hypothetical protein
MDDPFINRIQIHNERPKPGTKAGTEKLQITLVACVPDPNHPGRNDRFCQIVSKSPTDAVDSLRADFTTRFAQYKNMSFDILYNHLTYKGCTIASCEIVSGAVVELVPHEAVKHAVEIEGFQFSYWALLPLMVAASLIWAGLLGTFSMHIRVVYVLIGTVVGVPSLTVALLGVFESFTTWTGTGVVGEYWFSPNCCTRGDGRPRADPL